MSQTTSATSLPTGLADHACIGCGYVLRGLRYEQACPECGTPAAKSVGVTRSVSAVDMAILVCRGLALWLMARAGLSAVEVLVSLPFIGSNWAWGRERLFLLLTTGRLMLLMGIGVTAWWMAPQIASRIAKPDKHVEIHKGWVDDATSVAFAAVGLLLLADNVPDVFAAVISGWPVVQWSTSPDLLLTGGKSLIGLVLLVHPRSLRRTIAWSRGSGVGRVD